MEHYEKGWKDRDFIAEVQKERGVTKAQAAKWLRDKIPSEKYFQKKIMEALREEYPDAYIVKVSQGAYSIGGIPDIMCIVQGRYFGFEVKRPVFGEVSSLQELAIRKINASGGAAAIVTYPEEAIQIIRQRILDSNGAFVNNPFDLLTEVFQNLHPEKRYQAVFDEDIKDGDGKEAFGETFFPDDGSSPTVSISAYLSIKDAIEIFAHELAHVAAGKEHDHDEAWEMEFQKIFDEYNRIGNERFSRD